MKSYFRIFITLGIIFCLLCYIQIAKINKMSFASKPVFKPAGGVYNSTQSVSISSATAGAIIKYTIDGTQPSEKNGMIYKRPFDVSSSLKAIAIAFNDSMETSELAVAEYTMKITSEKVEKSAFSLAEGTYEANVSLSLNSITTGATIIYTNIGLDIINDSDMLTPIDSGVLYDGPFQLNQSCVIKAIAQKDGMINSDMAVAKYVISPVDLRAARPLIKRAIDTDETKIKIEISSPTPNASIYYTLDDTAPTTASSLYGGPFSVDKKAVTVNAIAVAKKMRDSDMASETFENVPAADMPRFSLDSGEYVGTQSLVLTSNTPGATIYYTMDATVPSKNNATIYRDTIEIGVATQTYSSVTVKAIAIKDGIKNSQVAENKYTIIPPVALPIFKPAEGRVYESTLEVEITFATPGAEIYYTLNDSAPPLRYENPIIITQTTTIKAFARKDGMQESQKEAKFIIR